MDVTHALIPVRNLFPGPSNRNHSEMSRYFNRRHDDLRVVLEQVLPAEDTHIYASDGSSVQNSGLGQVIDIYV